MKGNAFERRARNVRFGRSSREADHHSASFTVPMRRTKPHESRNEIDTAVIRHTLRKLLNLLGRIKKLQAVPEPLNNGPGNKNRAFECIQRAIAAELPCRSADQPMLTRTRLASNVHQKEATCTISIFSTAWSKTCLSECCSLLVASDAGHGNCSPQHFRHGFAYYAGTRNNLWKH